mmetsp:Transcript_10337/g.29028  ORF Transcript_10337/g.29028 Transcript_10337/m.29028 type:complete len:780 (+) Transcript_10337:168-2507(+)|eukprot:CAMPEP_0119121772 /NCGR_PEP_ID=MMETSP1310-20130426/2244_1 /TAXON_ID=464262 /ORGANISM="Genus nov. species nov., Strain RCC2339" /LENGTH=779 /DNA_ID=CAMNT_0007111351 /DNA_START=163 /DNA_END=2502 /DNA_ORIENTATION=-
MEKKENGEEVEMVNLADRKRSSELWMRKPEGSMIGVRQVGIGDVSEHDWEEVVELCVDFLTRRSVSSRDTQVALPIYCIYILAMATLMATLFFSTPLWCWNSYCGDPDDVVTMGIPTMPNAATLGIQLGCFLVVLLIRGYALGSKYFSEDGVPQFRDYILILLLLFGITDNIISLALLTIREYPLAQLAIPFIVAFSSQTVVNMLQYLVITAGKTGAIGAVVMGFILVWSWLGYMIFLDTPQDVEFGSYWGAVLDMMVLATTSNHPDVLLPAFYDNRWSYFYFLPFIVLTLWCLLLLLTIIMYDRFKEEMDKEDHALEKWRMKQLDKIFVLLNQGDESVDVVSTSVMVSFLNELRNRSLLHNLSKQDETKLLVWIERGGEPTISSQEFGFFLSLIAPIYIFQPPLGYGACRWLDAHIWGNTEYHVRKGGKDVEADIGVPFCARITHHKAYEPVVDVLIVLSVAVIAAESAAYDKDRDYDTTPYLVFNTFFTYLFVGELILRIASDGFAQFWLDGLNRIDFVIVVTNLVLSIIGFTGVIDRGIYNILLAFRILRLLRLCLRFDGFVALIAPFTTVSITTYCGVFFNILLVLSFFALVGNLAFGGALYRSNPDLVGTDYANANYFGINFNDFASALVLEITMLVANNWQNFMDATAVATHSAANLYFVVVIIVGPFLFITTLTSLVFDAYMKGKEDVIQLKKSQLLVGKVLGEKLVDEEDVHSLHRSWRTMTMDNLGDADDSEDKKKADQFNLGVCLKCRYKLDETWIVCPACSAPCQMYD